MFTRWILLFTLAISSWSLARASFDETAMDNFVNEVTKSCPSDGIPVCGARGTNYFLFPNECWLNEVNAEDLFGLFENIKKVAVQYCIKGCDLMCPHEYDPVCAFNVRTQEQQMFRNMCEVTEYACRTNTDFLHLHPTACPQSQLRTRSNVRPQFTEVLPNSMKTLGKRSRKTKRIPIPCTDVFRPVCAAYMGVKSTFKNECLLNAENIKFDKDWRVIKFGICDEDYSNVRSNQNHKPSKVHSIIKRSYGSNPDYMSFQNRDEHNLADFKPDIVVSSNDMYRYMPNLFPPHYVERDLPNSPLKDHVANNIMQKIISLPPPNMDATSQGEIVEEEMDGDQQFVAASNVKPLQYRGNSMDFNYNRFNSKANENIPTVSQAFKGTEHHSSESQAMEINSYAENISNNEDNYYYQTVYVSTTTTPVPKRVQNIPETSTKPMPVVRKVKTLPKATTSPPVIATTSPSVQHIFIISRRTTPISVAPKKIIPTTTKKSNVCKLGTEPICGILSNGEVRTFGTICEMMTRNVFQKNNWEKLHDGTCESCKTDCSREYRPVCCQRNGVNYTMVNDCYYNMGICLDKRSKWKKISNGECKRYTRIPDKYENIKPGFQFTSKYFVTTTTQTASSKTPISSTSSSHSVIPTTSTMATTKSTKPRSRRRYRKRISSSNRKVTRRSRPAVGSKNIETSDSYVMNLAKRKTRRNHSAVTDKIYV